MEHAAHATTPFLTAQLVSTSQFASAVWYLMNSLLTTPPVGLVTT